MYKRVLAIGDVHGQYEKLLDLWGKIKYNDNEDFLIFLGDYIDRGKQSLECLKFVKEKVEQNKNVHALKGNHEEMMLDYIKWNGLNGCFKNDLWTSNGGLTTLQQLKQLDKKEYNELMDFVRNLEIFNDSIEGYFFVHAGIDPTIPFDLQSEDDMLWIRYDCYGNYNNNEITLVVGHTPVQYINKRKIKPLILENNIIMMDTGTAIKKKLSCMDVKTKKVWQSF